MRVLKSLFLVGILCASFQVKGQFREGDIMGSASIGLLPQIDGTTSIPPLGIAVEYAITENFMGGVYLGYTSATGSDIYVKWRDNLTTLAFRGTYNHEVSEDLHVYAGALLGYSIAITVITEGSYPISFGNLGGLNVSGRRVAFFGGARYFLSDNFSVFGEAGYGLSLLTIGLNVNLGRR